MVGGMRILVVYHPPSKTAVAFACENAGRALDFTLVETGTSDVTLREKSSGSIWSGLTGRCKSGLANDAVLRQINCSQFVVENWKLHYPKGGVYQRGSN